MAFSQNRNTTDALLRVSGSYAATKAFTYSDVLDLGAMTKWGTRLENFEFLFKIPAVTNVMNPDTTTNTFSVQVSDEEDFSKMQEITYSDFVQIGSSTGAKALEKRFKLDSGCPRYVRIKCVRAGTGTVAEVTEKFTLEIVT